MIAFHLPINPPTTTAQTGHRHTFIKRGERGFISSYKSSALKQVEHDYMTLIAPFRPEKPLEGPLKLSVCFVFPWRKSETKKNRALGIIPHTSKPDTDNAVKALKDCMTKMRFWFDDAQIADERITKAWGDDPGIAVDVAQTSGEWIGYIYEYVKSLSCRI